MRRAIFIMLLFSGSGVLFVNRAEGQEIPERIIELITEAAEGGGDIPDEGRWRSCWNITDRCWSRL